MSKIDIDVVVGAGIVGTVVLFTLISLGAVGVAIWAVIRFVLHFT